MRPTSNLPHDNEFRAWLIVIGFAIIGVAVSSVIAAISQAIMNEPIQFSVAWDKHSGYFGISILITGLLLIFGTKATKTKKT